MPRSSAAALPPKQPAAPSAALTATADWHQGVDFKVLASRKWHQGVGFKEMASRGWHQGVDIKGLASRGWHQGVGSKGSAPQRVGSKGSGEKGEERTTSTGHSGASKSFKRKLTHAQMNAQGMHS